jgi:hypothetical protein
MMAYMGLEPGTILEWHSDVEESCCLCGAQFMKGYAGVSASDQLKYFCGECMGSVCLSCEERAALTRFRATLPVEVPPS